ncbi:hypothetical protein BB560_004436 [Smittium megazygosporum]|uniref:Fanconi-associated nuclease n=1 Tax=Smittium megazygosporum TaxID=133381 RepID=A0A2T9Z9F4_9FUNG|nr:hypothetical protein BB560_004436 [Smittium megazygosporum]
MKSKRNKQAPIQSTTLLSFFEIDSKKINSSSQRTSAFLSQPSKKLKNEPIETPAKAKSFDQNFLDSPKKEPSIDESQLLPLETPLDKPGSSQSNPETFLADFADRFVENINKVENSLELSCDCRNVTDGSKEGALNDNILIQDPNTWLDVKKTRENLSLLQSSLGENDRNPPSAEALNIQPLENSNIDGLQDLSSEEQIYSSTQSFLAEEHGQSTISNQQSRMQTSYYLSKFELILSTVLRHEHFLFCASELEFFYRYWNLSVDARYLFVRLFLRKHSWIQLSQIKYSDIDLNKAISELCSHPSQGTQDVDLQLEPSRLNSNSFDENHSACKKLLPLAYNENEISDFETVCENLSLPCLKQLCKECGIFFDQKSTAEYSIAELSNGLPAGDTESWLQVWNTAKPYVMFWASLVKAKFLNNNESIFLPLQQHTDIPEFLKSEKNMEMPYFQQTEFDAVFLSDMGIPKRDIEFLLYNPNTKSHTQDPATDHSFKDESSRISGMKPDFSGLGFELWRRRFTGGWVLTRIVEKSIRALAALNMHFEEAILLHCLVSQPWFKTNNSGKWYRRLSLVQMNYISTSQAYFLGSLFFTKNFDWSSLFNLDRDTQPTSYPLNLVLCRETCIAALLNPKLSIFDLIHIEKRMITVDARLSVPEHLRIRIERKQLSEPETVTIYGMRVNEKQKLKTNNRLAWVDADGNGCTVEQVAITHYINQGMTAVHSESSIITTIFGFLFWDIIFYSVEGVFDTEYQTRPMDMYTTSFYLSRKDLIDDRISEIRTGGCLDMIYTVYNREYIRKTSAVGINWDYSEGDLYNLCTCLGSWALAEICYYLAIDYKRHSSGVPDICAWDPLTSRVLFAEVKGPGDTLSETQKGWIDVLLSCKVKVELCLVREHPEHL